MTSHLNERQLAMPYRNLGGTGLMVSALSFGTMTLNDHSPNPPKITDGEEAYELCAAAYKGGVNCFDCAEVYGGGGSSERVLGNVIQKGIERGLWERMDLVITTKLHMGGRGQKDSINSIGLSRKHLYEGCVASLGRLQLDYVDCIFCHRPDPRTPIEETVRGMNHLIDRGLAFYWGTSEWSSQMLQEARDVANRLGLVPPFFDQTQYSMIHRERVEVEYEPLYPDLGLTIWSPLAGGVLTGAHHGFWRPSVILCGSDTNRIQMDGLSNLLRAGKYGADRSEWDEQWRNASRGESEQMTNNLRIATELKPIADGLGCTVAQLALAWTIVRRERFASHVSLCCYYPATAARVCNSTRAPVWSIKHIHFCARSCRLILMYPQQSSAPPL
eukprot:COSAG02_NODE_781_length_17261_cov_433.056054_1_plen_387_part_00